MKRRNDHRRRPYNLFCFKLRSHCTESNKISTLCTVHRSLLGLINLLQLKLRCSNSFQNASVPNKGRSSNCSRVAAKIPQIPFLNSEVTGPIGLFTKFFSQCSPIIAMYLFKLLNDRPIRCRTPEQRVKAVNFDFCKKLPKLIGYHNNVPRATSKLRPMSVL